MLLNDHAGLYGPGDIEPGADDKSLLAADLRDERAEEIEWLADLIPARTGVDRGLVLLVLWERDKLLAEADAS